MKNKIGWCDLTWNPVWGCLNKCEYCYARGMAKRFYKEMYIAEFNYWKKFHPMLKDPFCCDWNMDYLSGLKDFKPTFLEAQFNKKFPKKPQRIFVGSMSEIYYWEKDWMNKVIFKIYEYPQHIFQFLTKFPEVYSKWVFPENCWLGVTITNSKDSYSEFHIAPENKDNIFFICIEPMLDYIPIDCIDYADWVIIGLQTNPLKIIKKEWVEKTIEQLRERDIPIFLKDSIHKAYPDLPIIKEFPKEKIR